MCIISKRLVEGCESGGCQGRELVKDAVLNLFPVKWILASGDLIRLVINQSTPQASHILLVWDMSVTLRGGRGNLHHFPESRLGLKIKDCVQTLPAVRRTVAYLILKNGSPGNHSVIYTKIINSDLNGTASVYAIGNCCLWPLKWYLGMLVSVHLASLRVYSGNEMVNYNEVTTVIMSLASMLFFDWFLHPALFTTSNSTHKGKEQSRKLFTGVCKGVGILYLVIYLADNHLFWAGWWRCGSTLAYWSQRGQACAL